ncbi:uncharacterized protein LOC120138360 [Hibiscus syriacus]|uniref:uncharacterized protein LOC120138360 n=1 Tax=Hibiscus syriacus TaxID=106335 RepID=UPI0019207585|nr:uncharacterized protein LOC120138360 [Hibiscus syriacus]
MGNARPTTAILQLLDRSHVLPERKIEDVIVKVNNFVFPATFLLLDCKADDNAPIISGHHFPVTSRILIDYKKREFTMRVGDHSVTINVFNTLKHVDDSEECQCVLDVDSIVEDEAINFYYNNFLQLEDYERFTEDEGIEEPENFSLEVEQSRLLLARPDMVEDFLEILMDDFSVSDDNFDKCLGNMAKISKKRIEVDKAKVELLEKLPPPTIVKGIRSFLGHVGFYRNFIKDFSKILKPLYLLLQQNQPFLFDKECFNAFTS